MSADDHGGADGLMPGFATGSRVADYRLEESIGRGGMAVVFRAHDERLERSVALKILAPALAGDEHFQRRFISESRAAAAIDDPHIVPVFAAGQADGVLFIAMRYVAGGDAQSVLRRDGPLPPARVGAIISPVASALDAAHRAGLVHRDVKPSNMLMDTLPGRPDHVYLSDFGLSKALASTSGVTGAGAVLGTLAYMSPEQIGAQPVDGRADQYSLACSAFELLAGVPPFRRDEPAALMYAHLSVPPPQLTSRRPERAPAVDDVLSRALAKVPGDRYPSCGQFADALRDALGLPPYRSGPRVRPAEMSPFPETADAPATEARIPSAPAGQPAAGHGSGAVRPGRRVQRRRILIGAPILAAAGVAAGLLLSASSAPPTTVPISVKSALPAVGGDVYVVFLGGKQANADVYGEIRNAANGEVAALYAQQFPYQAAAKQVGSVILHPAGPTARYEFQVTPTLATRYQVELFRDSASSAPSARSAAATIYVTLDQTTGNSADCVSPVCTFTSLVTFLVPSSVLRAEMAKPLNLYFGVSLSATAKVPREPRSLLLGAGHGTVIGKQQIGGHEFIETVKFSFDIGKDSYTAVWDTCLKSTEAADGLGLPGHHGCGDQRITTSAENLG